MMRYPWQIIILLCLFPLAGCSSSRVNEVTRFHSLPAPQSETIEVTFWDPEQKRSIQYGQYAEQVGRHLGALGYTPPGTEPSQLIARIGFAARPVEADKEDENRVSGSISIGVGTGGGHYGRHSGVGVGIGMGIPLDRREAKTTYVQVFTLDILRRADGVKLYEGRVRSTGRGDINPVIPGLIEALFQDFPGESGSSNTVRVKP